MKKNKIIQYFRNLRGPVVNQDWLAEGRNNLQNFIQSNSVRNIPNERHSRQWVFLNKLILKPMPIAIFSIIVSLIMGGGIVNASQSSLPNSPLYPIKLMVENVRTITTSDVAQKAELQTELASKRLQEIQIMQDKGQATQEIVAKTLKQYQANLEQARVYIAKIDSENNASQVLDSVNNLVQAVVVQRDVLDNIKEQTPSEFQSSIADIQISALDRSSQSLDLIKNSDPAIQTEKNIISDKIKEIDMEERFKDIIITEDALIPDSKDISIPGVISIPKEISIPKTIDIKKIGLISEAAAIKIAEQAGLAKGINEWQTSLYSPDGSMKNYVWSISNILSEFHGETVIINAYSGQIEDLLYYHKTY